MHKCTISRPRKQMHLPRGLTQLLKAGRSEMLTIIITNQPSKLWQSPASQWKSKYTLTCISLVPPPPPQRWRALADGKLNIRLNCIWFSKIKKIFLKKTVSKLTFDSISVSPSISKSIPIANFRCSSFADLSIYLHPSSESLFNSLSTQNVDTGWY